VPGLTQAFLREELIRSLRGLMNRVPRARADGQKFTSSAPTAAPEQTLANVVASQTPTETISALPATATVTEKAPKARVQAADLVAVSGALESTGTLTYWSLAGTLDVGKLTEAWAAESLDANDLPEVPSAKVALHRACKAQSSKSVLLRQHSAGGWTLTDLAGKVDLTKSTEDATLDKIVETNGVRVRLSEEGETVLLTPPGGKAAPEAVKESARVLGQKIRAAFDEARTEIAAVDVSVWLVGTVAKLGGVALRETGGFYFVPKATAATLAKVAKALKDASGTAHKVYEIPVMHGSGTIEAVLDSLRAEVTKITTDVTDELQAPEGMGHRAARNRTEELEAFSKKIAEYEKLLGVTLGAEEGLKALREKLAKVHGTRFNNLEVD
jgi:DNA-binding MarR family transcriptional regulator